MAASLRRKLASAVTHDERKEILTRALRCDGLTRLSALDALRHHAAELELSTGAANAILITAEKKARP